MLSQPQRVTQLREQLAQDQLTIMPCCYDALTAKLIEQAGYPLTFMSGFAVSASQLGLPDTGLISFGEMLQQGRHICSAVNIPVFGDADTGYGNAANVHRTVIEYAQAGFAGIMIEDQISPKRCGHTPGKQVVGREEAVQRIAAAVDARETLRRSGMDIVIIARTDARKTHDLAEAIERARQFHALGADVLFVEAPESLEELHRIGHQVPGILMANLVEHGKTPIPSYQSLHEMGFRLAAYPLTLLSTAVAAMRTALQTMKQESQLPSVLDFQELQNIIGFSDYYKLLERLQPDSTD